MERTVYGVVGAATVLYFSLQLLLHLTQDKREPTALATSIPFLSPIFGMSKKKSKFYIELRDKYRLPIYTLRLPGSRLYVINSSALISAVQKQHRVLAFMPIIAKGSIKVSRFSKTGAKIISTNTNGEDGEGGYVNSFHDAIHPAVSPGKNLDAMNRLMLGLVAAQFDHEAAHGNQNVKLFEWIKQQIGQATTDSVYGPGNPFRDSAIEKAFWTFKGGMSTLILDFPDWAAKDAIKALDTGAAALEDYFKADLHRKGTALVQARFDHSSAHGMPLNDIARSEFTNLVALLANTVPASFWMIYHIYSDPQVLADCRAELASAIIFTNGKNVIDMSQVKSSCPIFLSTFKEVLRHHSTTVAAREVMEDFLLNDQYLLKKGSTVMMPGPVQHTFEDVWGADVNAFNYKRFAVPDQHKFTASFRAFGGGSTLCSGRHFATTEILAFTAVMLMRFDVKPAAGRWVQPTENKVDFWEATAGPDDDVEVEIGPVKGRNAEGAWQFTLSESDKPIELSAEDMLAGKQ
ncbi:cytochrome P450 [Periconia macrospinosa]|uniref:Cytochrome P450 n=1 Tax=Periconia macrospinosa TaxID=97972 RepID=A0A2V1EH54_9PLEO|nr:cytochrome P450 [Periconia macrospinosa]